MRTFLLHLINLLLRVLPSTHLHPLKRGLWRLAGAKVGDQVSINLGCRIIGRGSISIGSGSWLGIDATFIVPKGASVSIGANCDVAPEVLFQCGSHEIGGSERRAGTGYACPITIGDGTWIGARVVLLDGADVGPGSIIAAGALVLGRVYPANSLLVGVPARVVKKLGKGLSDAGNSE